MILFLPASLNVQVGLYWTCVQVLIISSVTTDKCYYTECPGTFLFELIE